MTRRAFKLTERNERPRDFGSDLYSVAKALRYVGDGIFELADALRAPPPPPPRAEPKTTTRRRKR